MNHYANELLNAEDVTVILKEPPTLTVYSDETAETALLGSYSWQRTDSDGAIGTVIADGVYPPDCRELLHPLETTETTALLSFTEEPNEILRVRCWNDRSTGDINADGEAVNVSGNIIELKQGGYIYEITAQWDADSGYGGTAHYIAHIESR